MTSPETLEDNIKSIQREKEQLRSSLGSLPKRADLRKELDEQMNEL